MVKAIFTFDTMQGIIEMRVQGHADFDELGKDPVCAGASVLAFTAAQCIDCIDQKHGFEEKPVIHIAGGNVRVQCRPRDGFFAETMMVFNVISVGMQLLANKYPDHVRLIPFEAAEADSIKDSSTSRTD